MLVEERTWPQPAVLEAQAYSGLQVDSRSALQVLVEYRFEPGPQRLPISASALNVCQCKTHQIRG